MLQFNCEVNLDFMSVPVISSKIWVMVSSMLILYIFMNILWNVPNYTRIPFLTISDYVTSSWKIEWAISKSQQFPEWMSHILLRLFETGNHSILPLPLPKFYKNLHQNHLSIRLPIPRTIINQQNSSITLDRGRTFLLAVPVAIWLDKTMTIENISGPECVLRALLSPLPEFGWDFGGG